MLDPRGDANTNRIGVNKVTVRSGRCTKHEVGGILCRNGNILR